MDEENEFNFPAIVNGKEQAATVLSEEGGGLGHLFRIRFSDGYEDLFSTKDGKPYGLKGEASQPYADAAGNDMYNFLRWVPEHFWTVLPYETADGPVNIWIFDELEEAPDDEGGPYYSCNVYVGSEYRFHMMYVVDGYYPVKRNNGPLTDDDQFLAEFVNMFLESIDEAEEREMEADQFIVKVLLSASSANGARKMMIYDKEKKHEFNTDVDETMLELMKGRLRAYFYANMMGEQILIKKEAPRQNW